MWELMGTDPEGRIKTLAPITASSVPSTPLRFLAGGSPSWLVKKFLNWLVAVPASPKRYNNPSILFLFSYFPHLQFKMRNVHSDSTYTDKHNRLTILLIYNLWFWDRDLQIRVDWGEVFAEKGSLVEKLVEVDNAFRELFYHQFFSLQSRIPD